MEYGHFIVHNYDADATRVVGVNWSLYFGRRITLTPFTRSSNIEQTPSNYVC